MNALIQHCHIIKPMPFVGQTSGKRIKGQSQKVQQAVLKEFRAGDYNVLVATSIGEEGLDIGEVDLVICFDANISPLRMIQRMGRTGRKRKGRVVILATDGEESKGYMRKKSKANQLGKLLQDGGRNTFEFHQSPPMVPKEIFNNVHYVELIIPEWVPKGIKVKALPAGKFDPGSDPLTADEREVMMTYPFIPDEQPLSLISFPRFQRTLCPVSRVKHSKRTKRLFVNIMRCLSEPFSITGSLENNTPQIEEESEDEPYSPIRQPNFSSLKRRRSAEDADTQDWEEELWNTDFDCAVSMSWMKSQREKKRSKSKGSCPSLSGSGQSGGFTWASKLKDAPDSGGSRGSSLGSRRPLRSRSLSTPEDDKENSMPQQSSLRTRSAKDDAIDALLSPTIPLSTPRRRGSAEKVVQLDATPNCDAREQKSTMDEAKASGLQSSPSVLGDITNKVQTGQPPPIKRRLGLPKRPGPIPRPLSQQTPPAVPPSEDCTEKATSPVRVDSPPRKGDDGSSPVEVVPDTPEQETGPCSAPLVSSPVKRTENSACREILQMPNSARHIGSAIRAAALAVRPLSMPFKAPGRVVEARLAFQNFIRATPGRMPSSDAEAGEKAAAKSVPPMQNLPTGTPCFPPGSDDGKGRRGADNNPVMAPEPEDIHKTPAPTPRRVFSPPAACRPLPRDVPAASPASEQGTTESSDFVGLRRKGIAPGTGGKSVSEEWQPPSREEAPASVRQPAKRKRLRKIGRKEVGRNAAEVEPAVASHRKKAHGGAVVLKTLARPAAKDKPAGGRSGIEDFFDEEAEVSEDTDVSEDEDEGEANSVDDSFIDDRTPASASHSASQEQRTQDTESPVNMMDIYRQSLLSQVPLDGDALNMPRFASPPRFGNPNKVKLQYARRAVQDTPSSLGDDITRSKDDSEDVEAWTEGDPSAATATPFSAKLARASSPLSDTETPLYPRRRGPHLLLDEGTEERDTDRCGTAAAVTRAENSHRPDAPPSHHKMEDGRRVWLGGEGIDSEKADQPLKQTPYGCPPGGVRPPSPLRSSIRACQWRPEPAFEGGLQRPMQSEAARNSGNLPLRQQVPLPNGRNSGADYAELRGGKIGARPREEGPPERDVMTCEFGRQGRNGPGVGAAKDSYSGRREAAAADFLFSDSDGEGRLQRGLGSAKCVESSAAGKHVYGRSCNQFPTTAMAAGRPEEGVCGIGEVAHNLVGRDMELMEDDDWLSSVDLDALEEAAMKSRSAGPQASTQHLSTPMVVPSCEISSPDGRPAIARNLGSTSYVADNRGVGSMGTGRHGNHGVPYASGLPQPTLVHGEQFRVPISEPTREVRSFSFAPGNDLPCLGDDDEDKWDCSPSFDLGIQF